MSSIVLFLPVMLLGMLGVFAQAYPDIESWSRVLLPPGIAVYMIYWFSTRMENRMLALERVQYIATKKDLLLLAVNRLAPEEVRQEAKNLRAELERTPPPEKRES